MTGILSWIGEQTSLGVVVMIVQERTISPLVLSFHRSHNPAKANGLRSFIVIA